MIMKTIQDLTYDNLKYVLSRSKEEILIERPDFEDIINDEFSIEFIQYLVEFYNIMKD